jgi:hypothetical protein
MRQVTALFAPSAPGPHADGATVVAFRTGQSLESLLPEIQRVLKTGPR